MAPPGREDMKKDGQLSALPPLDRVLRKTVVDPDITALQKRLKDLDLFKQEITGEFDDDTQAALLSFQWQTGLAADGIAGPETWSAPGDHLAFNYTTPAKTLKMADIAMAECTKRLRWTVPTCEAEKYLALMRGPMQRLGQIGTSPVFYSWCASFVTWCARSAGISIPDQPDGYDATMALVDSWRYWAKQKGFWLPTSDDPMRGDVVVFKWKRTDTQLDHIGIVASYASGSLMTYEGNRRNQTVYGKRNMRFVAGIIRIADER